MSLGEQGFDDQRFGLVSSDEATDISHVLPVLMQFSSKSTAMVQSIRKEEIYAIVSGCAGYEIGVLWDFDSSHSVSLCFEARTLMLSSSVDCGFQDLILAATTFRIMAEMGNPASYDRRALVRETRFYLLEHLPQAFTYSTLDLHWQEVGACEISCDNCIAKEGAQALKPGKDQTARQTLTNPERIA